MLNVFQTCCLKGFKLKRMVVEPKTAQPIEPDVEPTNLFNSTNRRVQKLFLSFPERLSNWSKGGRSLMVTCQASNTNG